MRKIILLCVLLFPVAAFGQSREADARAKAAAPAARSRPTPEDVESLREFLRNKREPERGIVPPDEQTTLELVRNGGFEENPEFAGWVENRGIIIRSGIRRTGQYSAALGISDDAFDELQQGIALPSGIGAASVSFYMNITSDESQFSTADRDLFGIQLRRLDNNELIKTLDAWSNRDQQSLGVFTLRGPYDISVYRGLGVRLSFVAINDDIFPSDFRIDDVSLKASPAALDFSLSLSPSVVNVVQTEAASYSLDARSTVGGITINLSADSLPPGCTAQFGQGLFPIVVRVVTSLNTPPGLQSFRIRGESSGVVRFVSGQMMVVKKPSDFTPPTVRLLSPNDVKKLKRGNSVTVTWESADNVGVTRHDVFFSGDAGASFTLVGAGLGGQTKSFTYTIPSTIPKSPAGYFRVRATDEAGNSASDENDKPFKVK